MGMRGRLPLLLTALIVAVAGCSEPDRPEEGPTEPQRESELRLASLSPALSRTLIDFGLRRQIVGRSTFCDFLDEEIPVVGDLSRTNYEALVELAPTHVLVQAEADPKLIELAAEHGWRIEQWGVIDTIDDIEQMVREMPGRLFSPGTAGFEALTARAAVLLNEIASALAPGADAEALWRGPTLLVYNIEPVGVFGRGTYLHDVLARFGASNAVHAEHWAELSLEDVARLNPAAIIIIRPGADPLADPLQASGVLAGLRIDAVRDRRIAVLSHEDALRPCTGIIGVAGQMRSLLRSLGTEGGSGP